MRGPKPEPDPDIERTLAPAGGDIAIDNPVAAAGEVGAAAAVCAEAPSIEKEERERGHEPADAVAVAEAVVRLRRWGRWPFASRW